VGGGYFLSRCPGRLGEYLGLTGHVLGGTEAMSMGLADALMDSGRLTGLWETLGQTPFESGQAVERWCRNHEQKVFTRVVWPLAEIDRVFSLDSVGAIVSALATTPGDWAAQTLAVLNKRSPLMLHVVLEQVRRARRMGLADALRMERDMVRHCFQLRPGAASETVEGIRALAVDKDHSPRWNPARVDEVTPEMVAPFFVSPWPAHAHPLRSLS
jgi:enoyl-CoA hydratase/carnithine racemase